MTEQNIAEVIAGEIDMAKINLRNTRIVINRIGYKFYTDFNQREHLRARGLLVGNELTDKGVKIGNRLLRAKDNFRFLWDTQ